MAVDQQLTTREQVRGFNNAFERPVHESWTNMSVSDRLLVGELLLEEVVEYVTKGLGLEVRVTAHPVGARLTSGDEPLEQAVIDIAVNHREGCVVNPIECVDGLADVNIVIHFNAHWHGFNLDRATTIVNDSNMSKLGQDGRPIINTEGSDSYDPAKPIGKILKGPNYWEPASLLSALICEAGNNKP